MCGGVWGGGGHCGDRVSAVTCRCWFQVITGYYATGHSSSGAPTPRYVSRLLQTLAAQDGVSGVMTYCAKAALTPCVAPPLFEGGGREYQLGCIVRRAYRAIAGAQD